MTIRDITNIWNSKVLNSNYSKFMALSEQLNELWPINPSFSKAEMIAHFKNAPDKTNEDYISIIENGSFFDEIFEELSTKYNFPKENIRACKSLLEISAVSYLSQHSIIYMKSFLKAAEQQITPLINQANKLKYHTDKLLELGDGIDFMFEGPSVYELVEDTSQKLQQLCQLREQLRNSLIAEASQVGIKAPIGNPWLKAFITPIYVLWTNQMQRSLTQSYDGVNGRKQFLEFLMDCLEPLDPTISFDTVDNALKKQLADWKKE